MALIDGESIDKYCRTCLCEAHTATHDIFQERNDNNLNLAELLSSSFSLKMDPDDSLPKNLCDNCYNTLLNFNTFKILAINTDNRLRVHLAANENQRNCVIFELIDDVVYEQKGKNTIHCNYDEINVKPEIHIPNSSTNVKDKIEDVFIDQNEKGNCHNGSVIEQIMFNDTNASDELETENMIKNNEGIYEDSYGYNEQDIKEDSNHDDHSMETSNTNKNLLRTEVNVGNKQKKKSQSLQSHKQKKRKRPAKLVKKHDKIDDTELAETMENYQQCDVCGEKFRSVQSLSAHKRKHIGKVRVLECPTCNKVFKKISHLKRHEITHNQPYKCTECPKTFTSKTMWINHYEMHNGIKVHVCPVCKKTFSRLSTFNNHIRRHAKPSLYLCQKCGKNFTSSTNLKQHIVRHTGLKTFACNLCPKKFITKGELKTHSVIHTGERSHKCEHCPAAFVSRSSWSKHNLIHVGHKPYQCDSCPMKFLYKDHLTRHVRIHTGERPYKCEYCERAFTQCTDLVKHKRMHLGKNMYRCDQCSQTFRLQTELRRHIADHYMASRLNAQSSESA